MKPSGQIRTNLLPVFIVCLLLGLLYSCSPGPDPKLTAPGISLALAKVRVNQVSNVIYNLSFAIPADQESPIQGSLTLSFEIKKELNDHLILDFNADPNFIETVKHGTEAIDYLVEEEHIIFETSDLQEGRNDLTITFTAGETGLNRQEDFIYTLFVPDRASTVFPCFDQPDIKGRYKLSLSLPASWKALSNGPLLKVNTDGDEALFTYDYSDPISTYLFSFAAGRFEEVTYEAGKYPMTLYHRETDSLKVANNIKRIFELHDQSIQWLESYTDIEYPFKKFDFVLIPGFQYGGMEHVGAIQYRASSLFLESSATTSQLLGRASLIAHETAHMWFGNLVTMRWFNDVWMKEVFANFMAAKMINPQFPSINHDLRFLVAHYPRAYSVDRTRGTHPIRQPLDNLKQAGTLYGPIIYQKAPIVMRKLEELLGVNNFKIGIQEYLKSYAYANASWNDLIEILDLRTDDDLERWSKTWVESPNRPVVRSDYMEGPEGDILRLSQEDPGQKNKVWPQRIELAFRYEDGYTTSSTWFKDQPTVDIPKGKDTIKPFGITLNTDASFYGVFDYGNTIKLTNYPFSYPLLNTERIPDPVTRGAQYIQTYEYFLHKLEYSPDYPLHLERYIFREQDPLNTQLLLDQLETVYWQWISAEDRILLSRRYETMLDQMIKITDDRKLKNAYFKTLVSLMSTEEQVVEVLNVWRDESSPYGIDLSETDFTTMAFELALRLPEEAEDILTTQLGRISNDDRIAKFEFIMPALMNDKSIRDGFFESLLDKQNRVREAWVNSALGYLHHPLRSNQSIEYLPKTLEVLEEIQLTGDIFFPTGWLSNSFWGHQSEEALNIVRRFLESNPEYNPRLKNKIFQATDMLERVVVMQLRTDLSNLKGTE